MWNIKFHSPPFVPSQRRTTRGGGEWLEATVQDDDQGGGSEILFPDSIRRLPEGGSEIQPVAWHNTTTGGEVGSEIPPNFCQYDDGNWGSAFCVFSEPTPVIELHRKGTMLANLCTAINVPPPRELYSGSWRPPSIYYVPPRLIATHVFEKIA